MNPDECISLDEDSTYVSDWRIRKGRGKSLTITGPGPGLGHEAMWTLTSSGCRVTVTRMLTCVLRPRTYTGAQHGTGGDHQQQPPEVLPVPGPSPATHHSLIGSQPSLRRHVAEPYLKSWNHNQAFARAPPGLIIKSGISQLRNQQSAATKQAQVFLLQGTKSKTCMKISNT